MRFGRALAWGAVNWVAAEVSGTAPLALPDAIKSKLLSLIQYGKCEVNNGTITCNNGTLSVVNGEIITTGTPEVITLNDSTASVENLYAVGDVEDEQNIITGEVIRRNNVEIYDGTQESVVNYIGNKTNGNVIIYPRSNEYSGQIVTFNADENTEIENLQVNLEPQQDLHGYDHPWPAGGGKNLFDQDTVYASFKQVDGSFIATGNQLSQIQIKITENLINKELTFSAYIKIPSGSSIVNPRVCAIVNSVSTNGNAVNDANYALSKITFTPVSIDDVVFISFGSSGANNIQFKDVQLEIGNIVTTYTPYENICPITGYTGCDTYHSGVDTSNPEIIPINWEDTAGTIYGGYIKVNEDKTFDLTPTQKVITLTGNETWTISGTTFLCKAALSNHKVQDKLWSNKYQPIPGSASTIAAMPDMSLKSNNSNVTTSQYLYVKDSRFNTVEDFKNSIAGTQVLYNLRNLTTYHFTNTIELFNILGINNIWINCGTLQFSILKDPIIDYKTEQQLLTKNGLNVILTNLSLSNINFDVKYKKEK